jgi:hypothetical protein
MRPVMSFLIALLLCASNIFVCERDRILVRGTPAVPVNTDRAEVPTTGPQAKVPESTLFGRLVGTWDVNYELCKNLDLGLPQQGSPTLRYDDRLLRCQAPAWTAVWVYPEQGMTTVVSGGEIDGRIVLTGPDEAGAIQRWSYSDIQTDSFLGRFQSSNDEGKTWRLLSVSHMHRHRT